MQLLILGANGFIGSNLIARILHTTDWQVHALDLSGDKLGPLLGHKRLHFQQGDMRQHHDWIEGSLKQCDAMLPLAAIATPLMYVNDPLRVFELDFEANLAMVRLCVEHKKRLLFPSTSEVYGMSADMPYDEDSSRMVTGPIAKERWIYSSSKQLLDRVIYAYGKRQGLRFTLFRPFNWFGPGLDNVLSPNKYNRVIPHFLGSLLRKEPISLVDGGHQQRCFLYIEDGVDAIMRMIENKNNCAEAEIFNIGDPENESSILELALLMQRLVAELPGYENIAQHAGIVPISGQDYYGAGY
ncbi:MAG: bifunctional UDP-4-keto-pentose/UDP-xylose synthase, partial [Proteobacteria bacterium]|nr:bifunctional UDP-4-keto-pentose/UDP-xylose synthase [Pseudomonadota bacterium]